jgi:hypothetical protein
MSIKKSLHKKKIDKIYFTLPLKLPSNPQFHIQPQEKKKKKKKMETPQCLKIPRGKRTESETETWLCIQCLPTAVRPPVHAPPGAVNTHHNELFALTSLQALNF